MKAITLRKLPAELARRLERRAGEQGLSLNRAVIVTLEEAFGISGRKKRAAYHDLDFLVGSLSKEDADALDRGVKAQRKIDPEVWA